jgi:hypothetical protein
MPRGGFPGSQWLKLHKGKIMNTRTHSTRTLIRSCAIAGWLVLPVCAIADPPPNPLDRIAALEGQVAQLTSTVQAQAAQIQALQSLLQHFSREGNEIYITGANLNVRDGSGKTWSQGAGPFPNPTKPPLQGNGLGNLIIGYNESDTGQLRTGSHNLVIGPFHSYDGVAGLVAGIRNTIHDGYASVSGGMNNSALSLAGAVSGGSGNRADSERDTPGWSSVSGGTDNHAKNGGAVSGGINKSADGLDACASCTQ